MEKAEALRTLRLDPSADGQMVTQAYWKLVREAQGRAGADPRARDEVEALNDAYATLVPHGSRAAVPRRTGTDGTESDMGALLGAIGGWIGWQALRTRDRWSGRNPEIALIGGGALSLAMLALMAGAPPVGVIAATVLVCGAIWAPWRRAS